MSDKETEIRERLEKDESDLRTHGRCVAGYHIAERRYLLDENARLRAELAERDKDAKRYRWLRDSARSVDFSHWISCTGWVLVNDEKVPIPPRSAYSTHYRINRGQFDADIDAAITEGKPKNSCVYEDRGPVLSDRRAWCRTHGYDCPNANMTEDKTHEDV